MASSSIGFVIILISVLVVSAPLFQVVSSNVSTISGAQSNQLSDQRTALNQDIEVNGELISSNLVPNPSFENGTGADFNNWTVEGTESAVARSDQFSIDGNFSLEQSDLTTSYGGRTTASERFKVTGDAEYELRAFYYLLSTADNPGDYKYSIRVRWYNSTGTEISVASQFSTFSIFDKWTEQTYNFTAPSSAEEAQVVLEARRDGSGVELTDVYWDDIGFSGNGSDNRFTLEIHNTGISEVSASDLSVQLENEVVDIEDSFSVNGNQYDLVSAQIETDSYPDVRTIIPPNEKLIAEYTTDASVKPQTSAFTLYGVGDIDG